MRFKILKVLLTLAVFGNIFMWHRIWRLFSQPSSQISGRENATGKSHRRFSRIVTIVVRRFENFENDVSAMVGSVLSSFPDISILIVCDSLPYPPLELNFSNESLKNVRIVNLQASFNKSFEERNPLNYVKTDLVLTLPDATRLGTKQGLQICVYLALMKNSRNVAGSDENRKTGNSSKSCIFVTASKQDMVKQTWKLGAIAVAVGKSSLNCLSSGLKVKEWSLSFSNIEGTVCDVVSGKHATMMETRTLSRISDPFMLPFPDALYTQTTALGLKIHILKNHRFHEGKPLYKNQQSQMKVQQLHRARERVMFEKLGIKKVTRASNAVEWYGCSRDTPRCFGSVVNGVPSYLYQNRYTPPCCLAGLRKVASHVIFKLEEVGIRFWLEGYSLLGAMLNGDILPWDHEVEIGFYRDDADRSPWLSKARKRQVADNQGYVWEKATEGEYFKVRYSRVNRLRVNLLPFFSKNGTMTRDAWFLKNHDFPEHFLHPMSNIDFGGRQVPSPNNVRDFLEIKFFKGVIEKPRLPGKLLL